MAQVSRESVDGLIEIGPVAIPGQETTTGEGMPKVVQPRPDSPWRSNSRHGLTQEAVEGLPHGPIGQGPTCIRHEESRVGETRVTAAGGCVVAKRYDGAGVQGHQPRLVELGLPNRQDASVQVGVVSLE